MVAAGLLRNLIVVGLLKILGPEPLGEGAFNRRHAYLSGILEPIFPEFWKGMGGLLPVLFCWEVFLLIFEFSYVTFVNTVCYV